MQILCFLPLPLPDDKLSRESRRIERSSGHEDDTKAAAILDEGFNVIVERLPFTAMTFVLCGMHQEVAVKLPDMVLGDGDRVIGPEYGLHDISVTCHFLLVAGGEGTKLKAGEELLHITIAEPGAFDTG